jgi:hypothetical protein
MGSFPTRIFVMTPELPGASLVARNLAEIGNLEVIRDFVIFHVTAEYDRHSLWRGKIENCFNAVRCTGRSAAVYKDLAREEAESALRVARRTYADAEVARAARRLLRRQWPPPLDQSLCVSK